MSRRRHVEQDLQRACVELLRRFVPDPPDGPAWNAVNPVPAKSKAVAGISKAMGLRKGWPDLDMLFQGKLICVEFKADNSVDGDQRAVHSEIELAGGVVYVVRSLDEFLGVLRTHAIPCRVRPGQAIKL